MTVPVAKEILVMDPAFGARFCGGGNFSLAPGEKHIGTGKITQWQARVYGEDKGAGGRSRGFLDRVLWRQVH